jgi:hypothetical protein
MRKHTLTLTPRPYSVAEVDALRAAVRCREQYGSCPPSRGLLRGTIRDEADLARIVEECVRTHMLAGHTAEDLRAAEEAVTLGYFIQRCGHPGCDASIQTGEHTTKADIRQLGWRVEQFGSCVLYPQHSLPGDWD